MARKPQRPRLSSCCRTAASCDIKLVPGNVEQMRSGVFPEGNAPGARLSLRVASSSGHRDREDRKAGFGQRRFQHQGLEICASAVVSASGSKTDTCAGAKGPQGWAVSNSGSLSPNIARCSVREHSVTCFANACLQPEHPCQDLDITMGTSLKNLCDVMQKIASSLPSDSKQCVKETLDKARLSAFVALPISL